MSEKVSEMPEPFPKPIDGREYLVRQKPSTN